MGEHMAPAAKLYLGGIPTEPEVRALREHLPATEGAEFTHEQIEQVIHIRRTEYRYRTVTNSWRAQVLKDENIEIAALPGTGFRCLLPSERVTVNVKKFQRGTRQQGRSLNRMRRIQPDSLDGVTRAKLDHAARLGAAVFQAGQQMNRELQPPQPPAQITQMPSRQSEKKAG